MKKAEATRQAILQKAFELTYAHGYQMTSIDDIIATTQVTKGAFYYHFKNKDDMGVAIVHEMLKPALISSFTKSLQAADNPLEELYRLMHRLLLEDDFLKPEYGCPAGNLIQEMTPWNDAFRNVLDELTGELTSVMTEAIEQGKRDGYVRADADAGQVTLFLVSGYWGIRSMGKLANSDHVYQAYLKELKNYLATLQ